MHGPFRFLTSILRTALTVLIVLWAVATCTFFLMKSIPGGPFSMDRKLPAAVEEAMKARYHLDEPLHQQYLRYLANAARGDLGPSYHQPGLTVSTLIADRSPVSAMLGLLALSIALGIALPLGIAAAVWPDSWADKLSSFVGTAGVSVPSFILGSVLLLVFSYQLRLFPSSGWEGISSAFLPAVALAALPAAFITRLVRGELTEVLRAEFLMTARAKGLSRRRVVIVHALRHTLSPVLAYLGPQAAAIMTGSFVVEKIFDVPGLGRSFVNGILNRDYPLIMGVTLFYTVILVLFNLLVDVVARRLDPRLR